MALRTHTLIDNLAFPPRKAGPRNLDHFKTHYISSLYDDPFIVRFWVVAAPILGLIVGVARGANYGVVPGVLAGLYVACLALSGVVFVMYAVYSSSYEGQSLVWLPWRQPWTWALVLITLPWLPFWLISALRLAVNWKRTRPVPLPIDY